MIRQESASGLCIGLLPYGATWASCRVPLGDGQGYRDYAGIALEAEYLPDSPKHPEWPTPDCVLQPGSIYRHKIRFQFKLLR